ncbi:MAG: hypothetical protein ACFB4I_16745 [Cyanophyceae cyanobacterium]
MNTRSWLWGGVLSLLPGLCGASEPPIDGQHQPSAPPQIDLDLEEESPVLQRWLEEVPNVLEDIRNDPSFRTRLRLGVFESEGVHVSLEDLFLGRTGLAIGADYRGIGGDRSTAGGNFRYYVFPLGSYINLAPVLGYRYIEHHDTSTDGIELGARLMLALSRSGAADIALTQSFVAPGTESEVGITAIAVGYAVTSHWRLSTDIQVQNSGKDHDSRFGVGIEWMP